MHTLYPIFKFPVDWLKAYVRRFKVAMTDELAGPSVMAQLRPTFQADFDAQAAAVDKIRTDQSRERGAVAEVVVHQDDILEDTLLLMGVLRDSAKAAYAGQDALLHSTFAVGEHAPKNLAAILGRADRMLAACAGRAEDLAAHGWSADRTKALTEAVAALKAAEDDQQVKSDTKEGYTASQIAMANDLYEMCCTLQRVARIEYSRKNCRKDPSLWASRAKFMLDEFPPARNANPPEELTPVNPPAGTSGGTVPVSGSGSGTASGGTTTGGPTTPAA